MQKNQENYYVSTDKSLLDIAFIHHYLATESYWAKNIPLEKLETGIKNSMCFGVYLEKKQVGFARMITDYATFAYLADVFIDSSHRGKGLSKLLMSKIMLHPQLQGLRRIGLFTRDAHSLYEQFGFSTGKKPENYMEIKLENPYPGK